MGLDLERVYINDGNGALIKYDKGIQAMREREKGLKREQVSRVHTDKAR